VETYFDYLRVMAPMLGSASSKRIRRFNPRKTSLQRS